MIELYESTVLVSDNINIDKDYRCKIDTAVMYDDKDEDKYFGAVIYYSDPLSMYKNWSLIMGLDKYIYFKSDEVTEDNVDYISNFIDNNIDLIKSCINNDAQALIHFNEFEKL